MCRGHDDRRAVSGDGLGLKWDKHAEKTDDDHCRRITTCLERPFGIIVSAVTTKKVVAQAQSSGAREVFTPC
jgi:hypothetical protein